MSRMQARYDEATAYLDARKRLKRVSAWGLVERFGLSYVAARQLLHRKQLDRGEISLSDLLPSERRAMVDRANPDLHAIAAGPIMDSNEIYLPAGKLSMAETLAREAATLLPDASDSDGSPEGEKPQALSAQHDSAGPKDIAQTGAA
jgi:hypothetical protein